MNKLTTLLLMGVSAAAGSFITYKVVIEKERKRANDEIAEMRDHYLKKEEIAKAMRKEEAEKDFLANDEELKELKDKVDELKYISDNYEKSKDNVEPDEKEEPYVINPEEYGSQEGYEEEYLVYYGGDEVLTDEEDKVVDIDSTVGKSNLSKMGEYIDGYVHIRNDALKTDYEVCYDVSSYGDLYHNEG